MLSPIRSPPALTQALPLAPITIRRPSILRVRGSNSANSLDSNIDLRTSTLNPSLDSVDKA